MDKGDWGSMTTAELWELYDEVTTILSRRMAAEKAKLEERLRRIEGTAGSARTEERVRRPYPPVLPKYRNPKDPSETWSGRGKQPRWLKAQLRAGKKLNDLLERRRPVGGRAAPLGRACLSAITILLAVRTTVIAAVAKAIVAVHSGAS
jgi:DNA-binding protein H-NS